MSEQKKKETTTIRVHRDTKERLENHGRMNETFDVLLSRILDKLEEKNK